MKKDRLFTPLTFAFLLSVSAFLLFLAFYGVLGFGNNTIFRGDLYVQYVDFIELFLRVLKGKEDFWYTFSQYYGSPSILTYAYYAFSPLNLLYLLDFIPIPAMTIAIITIKIGLCGLFFSLFAKKSLKCSDAAAVFFAVCYAMNSFNVTLHFNIIWLESAYLLPLLILLIHRLIKTGKYLTLIPAFVFLFLSNFYMAYMCGLFIAMVFFAMVFRSSISSKDDIKKVLQLFTRFAISVVLAAGICAAILLPCAKFLVSHMAADNFEFTPLPTSIFDTLNSMMLGVMPDIDNRTPFLYCGLPVVLFVIHYFLQKAIPVRERIIAGILLIISFLSIVFLPLFIFTHAFDYPNFYFFRNSAIICFLFCALATHCYKVTKGTLPSRSLWISIACMIVLYSFMKNFWPLYSGASDITNSDGELALNVLFLIIWGVIFMPKAGIDKMSKAKKSILLFFCFILIIIELAVNGGLALKHMDYEPFTENDYNNWYQAQSTVLSQLPADDDQLYRVSMYGDNNYNAGALFGYASFNTFSSSDQYALRMALYDLGIAVSNRSITEIGYTDLTYMLFDKGYTGKIQRVADDSDKRYAELEEFPWRLSIAYTVSDGIMDYKAGADPFDNLEKFAEALSGKKYHFFDRLNMDDLNLSSFNARIYSLGDNMLFSKTSDYSTTAGLYFSVPKDEEHPFYACFRQDSPSAIATAPYILGSDDGYAESYTLSQGCLLKGGRVSDQFSDNTENAVVYFTDTSMKDYPCREMYFARFDGSELSALHDELLPGILKLDEWSTSHLKGHVYVSEDHPILFTSIPWDEGWKAYVDGKVYNCESVMNGAFLMLRLTPGEHEIELHYIAPGAKSGLFLSFICLVVYLLLLIKQFMNQRKKY